MRRLFRSEQRIIERMLKQEYGVRANISDLNVLSEVHDKPLRNRMNSGFYLSFCESRPGNPESNCIAASILPRTLGLELFLLTDLDHNPVSLELLTGSGLPPKYFCAPLQNLHRQLISKLRTILKPFVDLCGKTLLGAPFLRLTHMYDEIHFLIISKFDPSMFSENRKEIFHDVADGYDIVAFQNKENFLIDGWMKLEDGRSSSSEGVSFFT